MNSRDLTVLMKGVPMGTLRQDSNGRLRFSYAADYLETIDPTPLSLSMPLSDEHYVGKALSAFLWGLLPDNNEVLQRWGSRFGVSANSPFALLTHVGEDCAGAVQFVPPHRVADLSPGGIEWLSEREIGDWVRQLRDDPAAWLQAVEQGQFSLAGAQSKFALAQVQGRWGRPHGAVPTTHILKPASGRFADQEVAEHLTLSLSSELGLITAESELHEFDGERVVVIKRYDRRVTGEVLSRTHQEDMCQALKVQPAAKYQSDGGPGPSAIVQLLRGSLAPSRAEQDVWRFVTALAFNWITGSPDGHAKNFSLLLDGPRVRLAPLYDLVSGLPYLGAANVRTQRPGHLNPVTLRLAMGIGGTAEVRSIDRDDWTRLAKQLRLDEEAVLDLVARLAAQAPDAIADVVARPPSGGWRSTIPQLLENGVVRQAARCLEALQGHPLTNRRRRSAP